MAADRARQRVLSDADTGTEPEGVDERAAVARVVAFSVLLTAGTVVPLFVAPLSQARVIRNLAPAPVAVPLLALLFAAIVLTPVALRLRGQLNLISLGEVPLLLGIVMVSPKLLVLSRLLAELIVFGLVRRQVWYKVAFNLAVGGAGSVGAVSMYRVVLGPHSPIGPVGWAAAATGLACAAAIQQAAVAIVVRLHGQRPKRSRRPDSARLFLALVPVASIALAVLVLNAAVRDMAAVVPLLLVGMLIVFAYRRYVGLSDRFGALQQLYEFSRSVGAMSLETTTIGWEIVEQVLDVMRTRRAELVIVDDGGPHRLSIDEDARRSNERITLVPGSVITEAVAERHPVLRSGRTSPRGRETLSDPLLGEFEEVICVPVSNSERVIGVLVALNRAPGFAPLDEDDVRLFETLAAHASTTVERARLVEELRLEAEAKSHQATHDALTGLPNRTLFVDSATASLEATGRAAIALLDLDRFKDVNDTLGHGTGDSLLCEVAARLLKVASGRATVARLGGDEFALVIPGVIGPEEATGIIRDIEGAISKPFRIEGITLAVTASAGVSLAPEHGDNVALLLQRADIAMYHAKEKRSGIEMYSASHDSSMQRKLLLGGQLTDALASGKQLSLVYQPIAKFESGEVVRVEALTRWFHPDHGFVPPDEFIGIADQMGLIGRITDFVLKEACAQLATWRSQGFDLGLSVNLSGQDLGDRSIVQKIAGRLREWDLPPSALSVEITETEVMEDIREASRVLSEIGELGVGIAVDDYGTGYSSLAYLHSLPLNELKLDRSFVGNIAANESNAIIVRSSIAMAHSLGLKVVAEGAEDELTCAMLADAGCDSLQGYYLSPPLSGDDLGRWLATKPRLRYAELASPSPLRVITGRLQNLG